MNTVVINIKTHPQTKKLAQKTARELGLSLSDVINGLLRYFIQKKTITFSRWDLDELFANAKREKSKVK